MLIKIKVIPNSKNVKIRKEKEILIVNVNTIAKEGKANKRLIDILSKYYSKPKSSIKIIKGLKSKNKIIEII